MDLATGGKSLAAAMPSLAAGRLATIANGAGEVISLAV